MYVTYLNVLSWDMSVGNEEEDVKPIRKGIPEPRLESVTHAIRKSDSDSIEMFFFFNADSQRHCKLTNNVQMEVY